MEIQWLNEGLLAPGDRAMRVFGWALLAGQGSGLSEPARAMTGGEQ